MQDYHFALLPRLIRNRLPKATIITFWHIPWPNPEAFAICPWRQELLDGLLGSSILGFHTQFHCNNFLDTVDRLLESRVDREDVVGDAGAAICTQVHRYPISIEWPPAAAGTDRRRRRLSTRRAQRLGLPRRHRLGIGIDRLDYTKGILERFNAVERLFELEPRLGRQVQLRPDRGARREACIERLPATTRPGCRTLADEINGRYPQAKHPPIILLAEHHEPDAVYEYHRAADICFVSSLHDGMNLVAKEFVAARDDEQGVLDAVAVRRRLARAARGADRQPLRRRPVRRRTSPGAVHVGARSRASRMRIMRGIVREFNVYRWAGRMLTDAAVMRERESPAGTAAPAERRA